MSPFPYEILQGIFLLLDLSGAVSTLDLVIRIAAKTAGNQGFQKNGLV